MRRALALVASLVSYGLGALVVIGPQNLLTPDRAAGKGLDLPGTIWIHHWVAQETLAGRFPVRTDLLFYPDGKNFLADTGANYVDAWLGMPLQWLVGVPQYLGWLGLLILVLNALAARSVVAGLTGRASAAWAAGMVVLLNPFTAQELAEGRPTQALIPFGILAVGQLLRVREGWRHAVLFGALVAAQAVTYWFTPYFLAVALLPVALVLSRSAPRVVVPRLAVAVAVTLLLTSPFLVGVFEALRHGEVSRAGFADWRDSPAAQPARWRLVLSELETASTLAMVALAAWAARRSTVSTLALLGGAALAVLLAAGARFDVTTTPLLNPLYLAAWKLPLFSRLGHPERALMGLWCVLPVAAALGLAQLRPRWALLFGLLSAGESIARSSWPIAGTVFDFPAAIERIQDGAVIQLPFAAADPGMVLQTRHGQPIFGGMGEREADLRPPGFQARLENPFVLALAGTMNDRDPPIAYTAADRAAITSLFRWVWLDRRLVPSGAAARGYDPSAKARQLVKELGPSVASGPDGWLWDLSRPTPPNPPGMGAAAVAAPPDLLDRLGDVDRPIQAPEPMRRRGVGPGE